RSPPASCLSIRRAGTSVGARRAATRCGRAAQVGPPPGCEVPPNHFARYPHRTDRRGPSPMADYFIVSARNRSRIPAQGCLVELEDVLVDCCGGSLVTPGT